MYENFARTQDPIEFANGQEAHSLQQKDDGHRLEHHNSDALYLSPPISGFEKSSFESLSLLDLAFRGNLGIPIAHEIMTGKTVQAGASSMQSKNFCISLSQGGEEGARVNSDSRRTIERE